MCPVPDTLASGSQSSLSEFPAPVYRPPHKSQPSTPPKLSIPVPRPRKAPPAVHAYGDSFVGPLELLGDRVAVNKYSGASAKGLNNPESVSQTGVQILRHLDRYRPSKVLLVFGHVDLQVVYLWKASEAQRTAKDAPQPDPWVDTVFTAYTSYILENIVPHLATDDPHPDRFITHLYVASVTMPTVPDDFLDECSEKYNEESAAEWQKLGLKLKDCDAPTDLATRRKLVTDFNNRLAEFCKLHSLRFFDINQYITDDSGAILEPYLVPDRSTIHVVWETTIEYWIKELADTGLSKADIPDDLQATKKQYEEDKRGRMERRSPTPRSKPSRYGSNPPSPLDLSAAFSSEPKPGIYRPPHSPLRSKDSSPIPPPSPFDSPRRSAGHRRQSSLSVLEGPPSPLRSTWAAAPLSNIAHSPRAAPMWRQKS